MRGRLRLRAQAGVGIESRRRGAPRRVGSVAAGPDGDGTGARTHSQGPRRGRALEGITPQERRILDLLADGLTNRQIADEMYLAEKTVTNYVSNLLAKLGMSRRTEAAVFAAGLVERRPHDHDT
jgi:DNA-binding NarL/FixJ family response regulator